MNETKCNHARVFYWTVGNDFCGGCCDCGQAIVGAVDTNGDSIGSQTKLKTVKANDKEKRK